MSEQIGTRAEYLECARVECAGLDEDGLMAQIAFLFRKADRQREEIYRLRRELATSEANVTDIRRRG